MGVHGLWRLLDSFGTVIQPDDLRGKRVAIDASIWIAQFRARVAPGEDIEHKVLEGFLARILKLLFYGIKPVFVFDGQASSSKGAEQNRRMRLRAINAQALLKRRAKQILMAQVAAGAIDLEELKKTMVAATDADSKTSSPVGDEAKDPVAFAHTMAAASDGTPASGAIDEAPATRSPHRGKRRRSGPLPPRRRRRLAPEAVSSRSTLHFLQNVEGLLEERTKHEACVLQNALHNSSTSLFMGPRRAVEDDKGSEANKQASGRAALSTPTQPSSYFFVVDHNAPQRTGNGDVISVTDSDEDHDGGDEDGEVEDDSSNATSDCCAVPSSSDVSVIEGSAMVLVDERNASLHAPSNANGAAVLQCADLTRFLTTLSPSTPPVLTPAEQEQQTAAESGGGSTTAGGKTPEEQTSLTPPPQPPTPDAAAEASESSVISVYSVDDGGSEDAARRTDEELEEGEEAESESTAESDSDTWEEENDTDSAADATAMTWEPFTQRVNPALLLQHLATSQGTSRLFTATPPRTGVADGASKDGNDDDDDFTPVKLGQAFHTRPQQPAVVTVSSSDGDEDSNATMHVSAPHRSGVPVKDSSLEVVRAGDAEEAERNASHTTFSSTALQTPYGSVGALTVTEAQPRTTPRPTSTRSSVDIVPFELLHIVELLDCCGVPYVLSPAEADAQCAFLARGGLVDAVFTEDSDVLVHGATTVLRGFFSQSKSVVAYRQADLSACGVTKTVLVALASLLGCDYTNGVPGIGLVGALEALVVAWTSAMNLEDSRNSPLAVLHVLRRWHELVQRPPQSWHDVDDEMTIAQFTLFASAISQWRLLEQKSSFPETHAVEAFYISEVDTDLTPFTWLPPNWHQIRIFAGALGALSSTWLVQRYELARKECLKREAEAERSSVAHENGQRRLTEYGAQERLRAEWAYQKQPRKHAAVLSQLRAVQQVG
ncbi:putative DNA repair protein RAD2 [Leptomonas seymouri]|uniref:Putative DNA repair protein RAD2 n=1 Tax=Leptomonas seymouri TaxID=5684 RepID=A0A0N0P4Y4_LEPSE|nr:putative DNA repair protein RAD2 [Leptomonas seymouri]|eukprot:KPI85367.1 putative DNA repair protein RAD2 [Leptomonas seymouri]